MSYSVEAGRDFSFEPVTEEVFGQLRMDNEHINAACAALRILKTKLGAFADPVSVSLYEYLIGEITKVNETRQIEGMRAAIKTFSETRSGNS